MLNKSKGNMYEFVTHTWNPIKGTCPHNCSYCYMKRFPQGKLRLDEKCLKDNLGKGNYIFVGSSTDMFAENIPSAWIIDSLRYCESFDNKYLFQSKNPERMYRLLEHFPKNVIFGTTIESNTTYYLQNCPPPEIRAWWIQKLNEVNVMVSIEPIMDFNLKIMVKWLEGISPKFISIGADSKNHNLPEPSWEKVQMLIKELKKFTKVIIKDNLNRLKCK